MWDVNTLPVRISKIMRRFLVLIDYNFLVVITDLEKFFSKKFLLGYILVDIWNVLITQYHYIPLNLHMVIYMGLPTPYSRDETCVLALRPKSTPFIGTEFTLK